MSLACSPEEFWRGAAVTDWASAGLIIPQIGFGEACNRCRGGLVYLATPYSKVVLRGGVFSPDASRQASEDAADWCARFFKEDVTAISPIVLSDAMVRRDAAIDPLDARAWMSWSNKLLVQCTAMVIPNIAGWNASEGIMQEVLASVQASRPVFLIGEGCDGVGL